MNVRVPYLDACVGHGVAAFLEGLDQFGEQQDVLGFSFRQVEVGGLCLIGVICLHGLAGPLRAIT